MSSIDESVGRFDTVLKMVKPAIPDSDVIDRPVNRRFTKEEKARILREAEGCSRRGT